MEPHEVRRLTTILSADVVGYSRLMAADEAGTHAQLKIHRKELLDPKTAEHDGRTVKLTGDGALMEFASVVNAVQFAVDVQRAMVERNAAVPEECRITFRIGINIGDIIVEDDDIYGDGVNVAVRLEEIADPGGICISRSVFDQLQGKLDLLFEDGGERQLKNISRPIHVWRWVARVPTIQAPRTTNGAPLPLPEKPSIAVLPFVNMSGDSGQAYFCDGITEDIITDLSRFHSLFVIARHSSFAFRGFEGDLRQVGRKLGVEHIVEGSVQRAGPRVRITAQLINAEAGDHLWAERYDRDLEDLFAVQDDVNESIVSHVTKRIEDQRLDVAKRRRPDSLQAYDYWLQAKTCIAARNKTGVAEGRRLIERALDLDPQFARAYAELSSACLMEAHFLPSVREIQDKIDQSFHFAQRAVSLDDSDSRALCFLGRAHLFRHAFRPAEKQLELATSFNPCDSDALMYRAQTHAYIGDAAGGVALAEKALRLNPYYPDWYRLMLTTINFLARRYEDGYEVGRFLPDLLPDAAAWIAATCAELGRMDEARGLVARFMRNFDEIWTGDTPPGPEAYKEYLLAVNPLRRQEDAEHLLDSLRRAGLPA